MFMMTSQILTFADSWKTQKSKYLENEIKKSLKKSLIAPSGLYYNKK